MSRKRRGFLDRDDALDSASSDAPLLPDPPAPPPRKQSISTDTPSNDVDAEDPNFDLNLPDSLEDPMPGFFGYDDDEFEGPPTEEVPNVPLDAWAEEFSPPLSVPEAPPLEGIIDGYTPVLLSPKSKSGEPSGDSFDTLFDTPPPIKKKKKSSTVDPFRLILLIALAIVLGLGVGSILAYILFVYDAQNTDIQISPPASILVTQEIIKGTANTKNNQAPTVVTAKDNGELRVEYSGKEGISVWVDGTLFGAPPITTMLKNGEHSIRAVAIKSPKKWMERTVTIVPGETLRVDVVF